MGLKVNGRSHFFIGGGIYKFLLFYGIIYTRDKNSQNKKNEKV